MAFLGLQGFVLFVTMCREALDDWRRYRRDKEANSQIYRKLTRDGFSKVPSSDIQVGDLIVVDKVRHFHSFINKSNFLSVW